MDCTTMKKPPSQTLLNYSIPSLAVSPELYSIIKCSPTFLVMGKRGGIEPPTKFPKWVGGLIGTQLWGFTKKFNFKGVHEKPIYRKGII